MFNKMTKNVLNISALDNRPSISAQELKATFDRSGVDIKEAFNGLVEQLASETAGEHIGANVESVATKTLQAVLTAFDEAIANRYTKNEVDVEVLQETNNLVKDFNINLTTGVVTVTKKDGTIETFDTALEKVPAKFEIIEENEVYYLKITNTDGTSTKVNINTLFNEYLFTNSDEISFEVSNEGNSKRVVAKLRDNSIGIGKLSLNVISKLEEYEQSASRNATSANNSAISAETSANTAAQKASEANSDALFAKSYAVGGTGTRTGENTDNAKYYKEQVENNLPIQKASGENVYIENAQNYPLISLKGEGKSVQEVEPTPENPQEIKTITEASYGGTGKNLLNLVDTLATTKNGITYSVENQRIKINGTGVSGTYSWLIITKNKISYENGTPNATKILNLANGVIAKGKLNLSMKTLKGSSTFATQIHLYDEDGKEITTTDENTAVIAVGLYIGGAQTHTDYTIGIQLEVGNVSTEYVPYQESTLSIDLQGNELASVGTVSDKLLVDRKGNVVIEKNVGKVVLDGSEDEGWIAFNANLTNVTGYMTKTYFIDSNSDILVSDYFKNYTADTLWNTDIEGIAFKTSTKYIAIYMDKSITSLKTWLQENNTTVYYQLSAPEIINLGTIENPELFKGVNNITVETNLGNMNIEVEYVEDLQKRIETVEKNGGSGVGGTINYNDLTNKPQINGIYLVGNKTSAELGIVSGGGASNILTFKNVTVETTAFVEDTTYEEFGYKAEIPCTGVTRDFFSDVTFNVAEALSGNYAPISLTGSGFVTIYAVEQPESTIIIPSIICSKGA